MGEEGLIVIIVFLLILNIVLLVVRIVQGRLPSSKAAPLIVISGASPFILAGLASFLGSLGLGVAAFLFGGLLSMVITCIYLLSRPKLTPKEGSTNTE